VRDQLAYLASQFDFLAFLQIVFVAAIFHGVLTLIRGTQADTLLRGVVALVVLILVVGRVFQLTLINWLLVNALPGIILVVAILFAPELRRMLERVGRTSGLLVRPFAALDQTASAAMMDAVTSAAGILSRRSWGALIVIARTARLEEFADTGTRMDATVSRDLLLTIFYPNSELHDLAVLIQGDSILAAGCVLPISESLSREAHLGSRHLAGLGISEQTDGVAVIVSEETGSIALAIDGKLARHLTEDQLRRRLLALFRPRARAGALQGLPAWLTRR